MPKSSGVADDRAKVKLRIIEFELEGANAAVENSVRTLTTALTTRTNGTPPKPIPLRSTATLPAPEEEAAELVGPNEAEFSEENDSAPHAPAKSRAPRKATAPEPIEVDLTTGDMPFKQFCDERNISAASADSKKYLVCAVWLKEYRELPAIEVGHVYTMYKMMKWNLPVDIGGPLRTMKHQKWFITPERGKFAVNHLGENEVNNLGK